MDETSVFYFAYGSNTDPERFHSRVGPSRSWQRATLPGHRLRFSATVQSEGGGGAVVDRSPGESVVGVVFEITADQLAEMDRVEFDPERDVSQIGERRTATVIGSDGPLEVELYTIEDDGAVQAPSERYLGHILDGLAAAGYDEDTLDRVRAAARSAAGS